MSINSKGDYLVFLSAHAIPAHAEWLESLLLPFLDDANVVASFSRQIPTDDAYKYWHDVLPGVYPTHGDEAGVVFSNVSSVVKKAAWEKRQFDEALSYAEDQAWARAAKSDGQQVSYCSDSLVKHSHNESFGQARRRALKEAKAHFEVRGKKGWSTYGLRRVAVFCRQYGGDIAKLLSFRYSIPDFFHASCFRIAVLIGSLQGFFQRGTDE